MHQRLSFIGESASLTKNQLAEEAIKFYSREKEHYIKAVRKSQADIRNGRVCSHQDLIKDLESPLADLD